MSELGKFVDNLEGISREEAIYKVEALINKARIEEHDWYTKHEVYQLNGREVRPDSLGRYVRKSDINKRLSQLKKKLTKGTI